MKRFTYDEAGKLREVRYCSTLDPQCKAWRIDTIVSWTDDGRPLTCTLQAYANPGDCAWTYDAAGRLVEKRIGWGIWTYDYDERGRLLGLDFLFPADDEGNRRAYKYGEDGRITRELWLGGFVPIHAVVEYDYVDFLAAPPAITLN